MSLASHVYTGIEYGIRAHAIQLPRVFRLADPGLYPGDLFVDSLEQYCSYFWVAVAGCSHWIGPLPLLMATHLLSRFLLIAAIFELTARWFPARPVRYIALAACALRLRAILAGEVLFAALPTHTTFAFALIAWGLLLAWRGRAIVAALLLAAACNCNVMIGLPAAMIVAVGYLAAHWRLDNLPRTLIAGVIWLAATAPVLRWAWRAPTSGDPVGHARQICEIFWYHLDPLAWTAPVYLALVGLLVCLTIGIIYKSRSTFDRSLTATLVVIVITWIGAVVAARIDWFMPLLRLQLGRSATIAVILSLPLAANAAWRAWQGRRFADIAAIAGLLIGFGLSHGRTGAAILLGLAVTAATLTDRSWLHTRRQRAALIAVPIAAAVSLGLFIHAAVRKGRHEKYDGVIFRTQPAAWRDVQHWARQNTPRDARFMAPTQQLGFRVGARRTLWFGNDLDAIFWRADLSDELIRRHELAGRLGFHDLPMNKIDWALLRSVADDEGIDYIVVPPTLLESAEPVYVNEDWAVARIRPSSGAESRPTS